MIHHMQEWYKFAYCTTTQQQNLMYFISGYIFFTQLTELTVRNGRSSWFLLIIIIKLTMLARAILVHIAEWTV